jgi:DNA repair protein RadD
VFPAPEVQLEATATTRPILSTGRPEWIDVGGVTYHRHEKPGKPPSLRVDYHCGLVRHCEWVCLEHGGYAGRKALEWWRRRTDGELAPATVREALVRTDKLRQPVQIAVRPNGRYTEVVHARFA